MAKVAILAVVATLWLHCSYTVRQRLTLDRMTRAQKKETGCWPCLFSFIESRVGLTTHNLFRKPLLDN